MTNHSLPICTAFSGFRRLATGPLHHVAIAAKAAIELGTAEAVTIYEDATGRLVEVDIRGSEAEVVARLSPDSRNRRAAVPAARGSASSPAR